MRFRDESTRSDAAHCTLRDGGIFGSPDAKDLILERELQQENIRQPALYIGNSSFDQRAR
ncbi:hypothetical protein [Pseudomonas sp. GOM6]|uniref:hypothetical protein n=1 Tax=Pseudomonas sp. GOM6 TaxID=3036944 RepID=UPI00240934FA|nr:hypothetical protein [Pseudomonas sp. GOM6]MDG1582590.1 hypothetical protein [Pseudomonas sp. GOM6]